MKLVHNKKSNLGLIFEYLLQEIIESSVKKDFDRKNKLSMVVKKHFFNNKFIKEEFSIFTALLNADYSDKDTARRFLVECLHVIEDLKKTTNERKLAKQQLLEDVYNVCDRKLFFEHNIKNYNVYATINLIIDYYSKNKNLNEIAHLIDLEKHLIEHIQNNQVKKFNKEMSKNVILESQKTDDVEQLVTIVKYREHYFNKLNESQKELMEYYLSTSSDDLIVNKLDKHYRSNHNQIKKMSLNETKADTKKRLQDSLNLFEEAYKNANNIEDKLKVVLDSYLICGA